MKKSVLVLLTFVPLIIGYMVSIMILKPVIDYLLLFFATAFWFYLGMQYARSNWKPVKSVLIAHAVFICSILFYLRQVLLVHNLQPSLIGFSKLFTESTPILLIARKIAILLEMKPYAVWNMENHVLLQVLALVYMVIVFSFGLYLGKKLRKEDNG